MNLKGILLSKISQSQLRLMGFRTCCCKIWHLGELQSLRWKSLRKQQKQEGHFDLSHQPSSLEGVPDPSGRGALPALGGQEHPYLQRQRNTTRNPAHRACSVSPHLLPFPHFPLPAILLRNCPPSSRPGRTYSGLTLWVFISFLMVAPCHRNLFWINWGAFLRKLCQFNFQGS